MTSDPDHHTSDATPSFWRLSWPDRFAYIFNRTALGAGVLLSGWHLFHGNWLPGVGLLLLVPVYFYLHDRVDAP